MRKLRLPPAHGGFGENKTFLEVRSLKLALSPWCIGGVADAREIAKQFTLELTVSTPVALPTPEASPCVTGCEATSGAVTTQSLRSRQTEGLSDKNSLKGEFGENQALWRVHNLGSAFSLWYTVGRVNADCASVISRRKNRTHGYVYRHVENRQTVSTI